MNVQEVDLRGILNEIEFVHYLRDGKQFATDILYREELSISYTVTGRVEDDNVGIGFVWPTKLSSRDFVERLPEYFGEINQNVQCEILTINEENRSCRYGQLLESTAVNESCKLVRVWTGNFTNLVWRSDKEHTGAGIAMTRFDQKMLSRFFNGTSSQTMPKTVEVLLEKLFKQYV